MQCFEVSGAVRPIYGSLGFRRLRIRAAASKGKRCDFVLSVINVKQYKTKGLRERAFSYHQFNL